MATVEDMSESRRRWAKRIVFAVLVSWTRGVEDRRTVKEEYATVKARLPEGTGLFLGHTGYERGEYSDAVVLLRGKLATRGDLRTWFDLGLEGTEASFVEPFIGQKLEQFLERTQEHCGRNASTCGERVVVQRGDAETLAMLEGLPEVQRHDGGAGVSWMPKLTERMHWLQETEAERDEAARVEAQRWKEANTGWLAGVAEHRGRNPDLEG
jgi:hypothetical protein